MKYYKYIALWLMATSLLAGCADDKGPDIDDHFLNYTIPNVEVTEDYQVGVFYSADYLDDARWGRLVEEYNPNNKKLGPWEQPQLGRYKLEGQNATTEMVDIIQQHVDWSIESGINFLILPNMRLRRWEPAPNNFETSDVKNCELITGKLSVGGKHVDMKSLKYVYSVNLQGINDLHLEVKDPVTLQKLMDGKGVSLSQNHCIEDDDKDRFAEYPDFPAIRYANNEVTTRKEMMLSLFKTVSTYFEDENYYKVGGNRPMVYIVNAGRMYSHDSEALYKEIRAAIKEASGYDAYIVAQSEESWTPPARYQYFYMQGKVDAVASKNMYDQPEYDRSYFYPQAIDQNWKYNREYIKANWGIDYIPTGGVGYNDYVYHGRYNLPIVRKNPDTFRTICNVMKLNAGSNRLVFIDSFNQYSFDSFLEPTKEDYGFGYGMTYLNIVKEQFKKK